MTTREPLPLQIGQDLKARQTAMPIALSTKRLTQSAKEKERHPAPSAHHVRQMAKLSAACSSTTKEKAVGGSTVAGSATGTAWTGVVTSAATAGKANNLRLSLTLASSHNDTAATTRTVPGMKSSSLQTPSKTATSGSAKLSPIRRPQSSGAFKPRKIEKTRFRYFYDRGDLPLRVNFAGAVRKIQWQIDVGQLDYTHYLPMFMEGLRELEEPYHFLAVNGTLDLIEKGGQRTLACIPHVILPIKQNLMTRNHIILCLQMKVLQKLVLSCPFAGEALVPYYRQLLSIFNLFITKRVNCGDAIDYGQRRQENLGDLIAETLNLLERHGGPDAFVNIKYMIPTYESCRKPIGLSLEVEESTPARLERKGSDSDSSNSGSGDDEDEPLETSCDIGETTLRKGPIAISRSGVRLAPRKHSGSGANEVEEEDTHYANALARGRETIPLDALETSTMIGRGASGHVLKARHLRTGELYAIKVVNNVHDKAKRDQMLTEIRTLYSVESPFLVDFYGAYFKDHALSIVLEYCAHGSLDQFIRSRSQLPERIVAAIAFQVLQGLLHLKKTHHFHRDIKPQNILMQDNGTVKLTDFGIARELGDSHDMAQTFIGTFKYMSPERVQNQPYDYKSDIWSLGLVLIECATKWFPYASARSYIDVVQSIIESPEPAIPDYLASEFSPEMHEFVASCMHKDPKERGSVEELLVSPWLRLHRATSGDACIRICQQWLMERPLSESKFIVGGSERQHKPAEAAKGSKGNESEDEIEEDIHEER
ncbi:TPA: hypothetical protein N0F65_000770 [Lagenidium giganteum]|uniref:Protein kinase domain-containing protein n=1 Tax=Lagenidium giganteum TaxID=4803 RepID=A0AAV2ZKS1_9STRA|nr:TPA: hypothetical protein N0F65_000770 [Lagenidium giganteum]